MTSILKSKPENVLNRSIILTNDEIIALPTADVEIIPAPGPGKAIFILGGALQSHIETDGEYAGVDSPSDLGLLPESGSIVWKVDADSLGLYTGSLIASLTQGTPALPLENTALLLSSANVADFTGGNAGNTLSVTVIYLVVELN